MRGPSEARLLQYAIAFVFLTLGGWCVVAPGSVLALGVRPELLSHTTLTLVVMGAFGAQAVLAGLFAAFSIFTRRTFLVFGLALLPFFGFDYWFYAVTPVFNGLIWLDVAGNLFMLALCVRGWWVLRAQSN